MAVHLFEVRALHRTPPLAQLLERIHGDAIADRLRTVGHQEVRVETIAAPRSRGNNTPYWLLDFTKIRFEHGPGKASREDPIESFELDADQGFGEETAVLYDPRRQAMLIQYNHYGARSTIIENYFALYDHDQNEARGYDFDIRMDEDADLRFAKKQTITKMHFKIAPPRMTNAQRGGNVSLGRSIDLSSSLDAESIEVIVSAGRGVNASLSFAQVTAFTRRLMRMRVARGEEPVLSKLEIAGRDSPLEPLDVVDLLRPKLVHYISDLVLNPADRRYTQRSRWDGLLRARNGWEHVIAG
ncbi:DUF6731 family protein [Caballeronia sp. LjRoot31]|uniref:DUF6731 family protein n=1 Tax=Caballeronia sp. LjRoot31 TaxID=3342324 RepID=UPI003ECE0004